MSGPVNPVRGDVAIAGYHLRPSFAALVAAEGELGSLFALVERATEGGLRLDETVTLFWHLVAGERPERTAFAEAVSAQGLVAISPVLRQLLTQILKGG